MSGVSSALRVHRTLVRPTCGARLTSRTALANDGRPRFISVKELGLKLVE